MQKLMRPIFEKNTEQQHNIIENNRRQIVKYLEIRDGINIYLVTKPEFALLLLF